jgi:hypothetical protein
MKYGKPCLHPLKSNGRKAACVNGSTASFSRSCTVGPDVDEASCVTGSGNLGFCSQGIAAPGDCETGTGDLSGFCQDGTFVT